MRPPSALRARVLEAAREAAARKDPGVLAALYHDRLLRLCAAGLAALVIANVLVIGRGPASGQVAARLLPVSAGDGGDDVLIPEPAGLTAAEQLDDLAPVLGDAIARSRG